MAERKYPWLAGLTDRQREAATFDGPRLAIVAAPGAGKTLTIASRIVDLVERRGVHPSRIVAFAFTRSAAAELKARVTLLGGDALDLVQVTTFHALALRALREDPGAVELPSTFTVAREEEASRIFVSLFQGPTARPESNRVLPSALQAALGRFCAMGVLPKESPPTAALLSAFARRLREGGLVQAGMLMPLLRHGILASETIRAALAPYGHVFVDEAHDASPVEMAAAEWMASPVREGDTPGVSITIVADPRQAIFAWRHACGPRVVSDFLDHDGKDARLVMLDQTFRFGREIARHANEAAHRAVQTGLSVDVVEPAPERGTGTVHAILGGDLRTHVDRAVAAYGAARCAILCRARRDAALVAASMPDLCESIHVEVGDPAWFKLAQALARLIVNGGDNAAFRAVYEAEAPVMTVRPTFLSFAARVGNARSLLEEYRNEWLDMERDTLLQFAAQAPPDVTFDAVAARVWRHLRPDRETDHAPLYAPFLDGMGVGGLPVRDALDRIATRSEADAFAGVQARGHVSVSTVHAAKGREWDAVFLVTSDRWPWALPTSRPTPWRDEEWRVYFVALTRACQEVAIVHGTEADPAVLGLEPAGIGGGA